MEKRLTRATVVRAGAAGLAATVLAAPTASAAGGEHPNVKLIQDYYAAYGSGDLNALRKFFTPDIRWTIPGHHPLAGTKTGADEVLAFRVRGRKIAEAINFAADQHAADAFFWRQYPLAPIPRRLA